jgi:ATP-dependent DNA helicase RecQ
MGMLIDILRGSNNRKIIELKYHEIKTFGAGKELKTDEWADYLQQMLNSGVMDIAYDEGHSYKLNNASWSILKEGRPVQLVRFRPFDEKQAEREANIPKEKSKKEIIKDALFERLRILRKQIADEKNIPPFVIFSDATISDMAQKKPINQVEMLNVSGVGEQKYRQYGDAFMREIRSFLKTVPKSSATGVNTYAYTFQLYEEGFSIDEIAAQRGLNPVTILSHLIKMFEEGKTINLQSFINKTEYKEIITAAKTMKVQKGEAMKPLFEAMDSKYDYNKIKIAFAILEQGGM